MKYGWIPEASLLPERRACRSAPIASPCAYIRNQEVKVQGFGPGAGGRAVATAEAQLTVNAFSCSSCGACRANGCKGGLGAGSGRARALAVVVGYRGGSRIDGAAMLGCPAKHDLGRDAPQKRRHRDGAFIPSPLASSEAGLQVTGRYLD